MFYRVRKSWEDRDSQIGTCTVFKNAKNMVDLNPGYAVFDEEGKQMYPSQESRESERRAPDEIQK